MRILVVGHRGMVGTDLCESLKKHDLIKPGKYQLNIGNFDQVMSFAKKKPEFIIHLAAETDHEYCDLNPSNCYFVNTVGTGNLTILANVLNIPILYLSAGSVFDGLKNKPYTTMDIPNPINHYNRSKYYGEIITRNNKKHYIIRAGWMFGGGEALDKKFVNKIITKIKQGQKRIKVCDDCVGSPTYTKDLSEMIKYLIENKVGYGTYHVTNNGGGVSRYEFGVEVAKIYDPKVKIIRCKIDDLKEEFPCKRTNYEVLENTFSMRDWRKALKEYINDYYRH